MLAFLSIGSWNWHRDRNKYAINYNGSSLVGTTYSTDRHQTEWGAMMEIMAPIIFNASLANSPSQNGLHSSPFQDHIHSDQPMLQSGSQIVV